MSLVDAYQMRLQRVTPLRTDVLNQPKSLHGLMLRSGSSDWGGKPCAFRKRVM